MDGARRDVLRDILITGIVSGILYFAVNLVMFFPSEQLGLMTSGFLKFNLFAYSLAIWLVAFVVLSAVMHLVTYPLTFSRKRGLAVAGRSIVYFVIALAFLMGHAVWRAYADTAPMLPSYIKVEAMKTSVMWALLIAALVGIVLGLVNAGRGARPRRHAGRGGLVFVAVACLVYILIINLPIDYANLGGVEKGGPYPGRTRTVLFGVDAGTWNVLLPLIEHGDLPAFKRMMDEGTYGYFDTYGQQYTPPSWASIATGKMEEKHGIHAFADVSTDWKAAPIWSIMTSAGKRVGVVNWVCTWPPFEVNGVFISKITDPRAGNTYFSDEFTDYRVVADSILNSWEFDVPKEDRVRLERASHEIGELARIHHEVFSRIDPDFVAYVDYSTDMLQHFFWKDMQPGLFTGKDWVGEHFSPEYSDAIKDVWVWADGFLADLMDTYGEYANYIVVSDHGARPIKRRQIMLDMVALLEDLGYLTTQDGEVRRESSICYPSKGGSPAYVYNLDINPAEFTRGSEIDQSRYEQIRGKIAEDLRAVRLEGSGEPLFENVKLPDKAKNPEAADIHILAGRAIMEMPPQGSRIVVGGNTVETTALLHYHPWSGRHRSRGIVLAKGPAIKHRYSGAWTIDEPYTRIYRYGHGIYHVIDRFSGPLRRLHLVDEVMNLDVTPTLLYLAHLPVARDMDGRVLTEIIESDFEDANPLQTVQTYRMGEILDLRGDPDAENRIKERLRALGYIQ
jgi:hypothetical protein